MRFRYIAIVLFLAGLGCATPTKDRPFTDDWAYVSRHGDDERRAREEIQLSDGAGGLPPTRLNIDERGKPSLQFGENARLRPEVSFGGGGRVGLKYEREF
ncbi:MAG: hypothetical protein RBU21_20605 [FCB group bacterium]|jgi:hypothetical protein|nr:hypothetical protein [FCB group bacterium]